MFQMNISTPSAKDFATIETFVKKIKSVAIKKPVNSRKKISYALPGSPMTMKELENEIEKSIKQSKAGKYYTIEEAKSMLKTFQKKK